MGERVRGWEVRRNERKNKRLQGRKHGPEGTGRRRWRRPVNKAERKCKSPLVGLTRMAERAFQKVPPASAF